LESLSGAVALDSELYVERDVDVELRDAIERHDPTVLVKGPRQVGKTSLVARGIRQAREAGCRVVFCDYQKLDAAQMESPTELFVALGEFLADQLDLEKSPRDVWNDRRSANANFERYVSREVLRKIDAPLVWAMDETDRLFTCPFSGEVFALFRTWHNARAVDFEGIWAKLTLVIAYATEARLFITDMNQSPFNVGTPILLEPFTPAQVADLNERYGRPLDGAALERFYELIGGQPFLAQRGLVEIVKKGLSIDDFSEIAEKEYGPYGDHLRRILVLLAGDEEAHRATSALLREGAKPSADTFYRMRSAGLLAGDSFDEARFRCRIYERFLEAHLR
jgi:hypothetical protein